MGFEGLKIDSRLKQKLEILRKDAEKKVIGGSGTPGDNPPPCGGICKNTCSHYCHQQCEGWCGNIGSKA